MVKKLMKYECISYIRSLLPIELVVLGIALITRLVQFAEPKGNNSVAYPIIFGSSCVLFGIACVTCLVMTIVLAIVRFYRNLFSGEGYLTFTLPVTKPQILLTKLLGSFLAILTTLVTVFAALNIVCAGDVLVEVYRLLGYLFGKFLEACGTVNGIFYVIEIALAILVGIMTEMLLFYACLSIGQLANKRRILLAIGVYFGYYTFCQILGTVLLVIGTIFGEYIDEWLELMIEQWQFWLHIGFCGFLVMEIIHGVVYYLISRWAVTKKLNLE